MVQRRIYKEKKWNDLKYYVYKCFINARNRIALASKQRIIGFNEPFGKCQAWIPSTAMPGVILFQLLELACWTEANVKSTYINTDWVILYLVSHVRDEEVTCWWIRLSNGFPLHFFSNLVQSIRRMISVFFFFSLECVEIWNIQIRRMMCVLEIILHGDNSTFLIVSLKLYNFA